MGGNGRKRGWKWKEKGGNEEKGRNGRKVKGSGERGEKWEEKGEEMGGK